MSSVALDFKGSERGSNLGPVANNGENIACGRQRFGMRPRNLRPCGRQWALSACRPLEACMGPTRCTPVALSYKGSEGGSKLGPVANNGKHIASGRQSFGMLPQNFRPCGRQWTP